jgi:hypothetical protein
VDLVLLGTTAGARRQAKGRGRPRQIKCFFNGDRYAMQRAKRRTGGPVLVGRARLGAGRGIALDNDSVQRRIDLLDALDMRLDRLG